MSGSGGLPSLLSDFGQKIDLCSRIREILVNYPPGTTILKEFVQNADDAGASKIVFCLDKRTFGTEKLAHERMSSFQGHSLLVHNDAVFSDVDFESIQNIGGSQKLEALVKTGRFGIGFNSCYHICEMPTFLSRDRLVMFDPQTKYLPDVNANNPGKCINVLSSTVHEHLSDQLAPYRAFGSNFNGEYKGTLFRLPLRSEDQAKTSRLSNQSHTCDTILPLLESFLDDAQNSLLFLKCVSSIEACVWEAGSDLPTTLWSCSIGNTSQQLRDMRGKIPASVAKTQHAAIRDKVLSYQRCESDYELGIDVRLNGTRTVNKWLVCSTCDGSGETRVGRIATDPSNYRLRLVPWAGVAAMISRDGKPAMGVKGRSFCFLPLPAETGLPVHVNGYFELSSNRRDIWRGDDMAGEGRIRAEWNKALLEDVVAPTYARMLLRLCKGIESVGGLEGYYRVWPQESVQEPWEHIISGGV